MTMSNGVSICITAYKTQDYIKECLDSVVRQTWFKTHNDWEIIVGIDGCKKTLEYMKTIMKKYKNLRVLMMDSNKGTYITSNTIISQAQYDNIFRFDSDDIMNDNLVETVMNLKGDSKVLRFYYQNFGLDNQVKKSHGSLYIDKSVFMKYGGFRSWLCSADSELYLRLKKVVKVKQITTVLMLRRVHSESLTMNRKTGRKSKIRKEYERMIREMDIKTKEDAVNNMETNTFKEVVYD